MIVHMDRVRKWGKWLAVALLVLLALDALFAGNDPSPYLAALLTIGWIACRTADY